MDQSPTTEMAGLLPTQRAYLWPILGLLFAAALAARLYGITNPPTDFHAARQYRSALIARGLYFEHLDSVPEWRREIAHINKDNEGIIEPPVMELLTVAGYRLTGGEHLWIPRVLSALFWVVGGAFLFAIAHKLFPANAAFFAAGFYLLVPYGVAASRSFQPEPLMVMLVLLTLWLVVRYHERPSGYRLAPAILAAALAVFIKPVAAFLILAGFAGLAAQRQGALKGLTRPPAIAFAGLSLLPAAIYYGDGLFVAGFLRSQTGVQFVPGLLFTAIYWSGWFQMIGRAVGYVGFVGALLGLIVMKPGRPRQFVSALWGGYMVMGLIFNYAISTHDYYQAQLIPVVALSLCPLAGVIMEQVARAVQRPLSRALILASVVAITAVVRTQEIRWGTNQYEWIDPSIVQIAPEIGERVNHSPDTIMLSEAYGEALRYHGEIGGTAWPTASDFWTARLRGKPSLSVEERFASLSANQAPEYFIVTHFGEFQAQADLREYLFNHYPVLAQRPGYIIFDLRPKTGGSP